MVTHQQSKLSHKKRYLQVALNGTLEDARGVLQVLPDSDRILIEAGTPFIKRYGVEGIQKIRAWAEGGVIAKIPQIAAPALTWKQVWEQVGPLLLSQSKKQTAPLENLRKNVYIVADMKTMDRGLTEVEIAKQGGADAVIALGSAPIETLNEFVKACRERHMDSMVDMMNVEYPLAVLTQLRETPNVVVLHRGVDEERLNKEKQIPLHEIRRIKSRFNILIAIAGGDTHKEVQRAIFNDADIVVIWKSVFQSVQDTRSLVESFLKEIK